MPEHESVQTKRDRAHACVRVLVDIVGSYIDERSSSKASNLDLLERTIFPQAERGRAYSEESAWLQGQGIDPGYLLTSDVEDGDQHGTGLAVGASSRKRSRPSSYPTVAVGTITSKLAA